MTVFVLNLQCMRTCKLAHTPLTAVANLQMACIRTLVILVNAPCTLQSSAHQECVIVGENADNSEAAG